MLLCVVPLFTMCWFGLAHALLRVGFPVLGVGPLFVVLFMCVMLVVVCVCLLCVCLSVCAWCACVCVLRCGHSVSCAFIGGCCMCVGCLCVVVVSCVVVRWLCVCLFMRVGLALPMCQVFGVRCVIECLFVCGLFVFACVV